ncbi:MAG: hypothetical protein R2793_04285 [Flavobacteriaceae bacterium]
MKTTLPHLKLNLILFGILLSLNMYSQVGINTTSPQPGSMLDITSTDKGMLVPRVDIANLNTIAPITGGATESLLVYNTNTTTGKGYYYWSGTQWIALSSDDWKKSGNAGTTPGTDFVGTTDNTALSIATNNTERIRITSNGYFRFYTDGTAATPVFHWNGDTDTGFYRAGANELGIVTGGTERLRFPDANQIWGMNAGSNALPFYSWNNDTDTGFWRSGQDILNISCGGLEMAEFSENGANSEVIFNNTENITDFRIATSGETNAFFVDGTNNNVGLGTNNPNNSAQLVLADNDRGILINKVPLTSTASAAPITSPATGLLVYNTANASTGSTEVLPGFYYWDGSRWIAMGGTGGKDWSLEGNAGTNASTNFLGTTDNTSLNFRTNDTERMEIDAAGTVGIGNSPYVDTGLRVNNASQPYGIVAETSSTGVTIYASDTGTGLGMFSTSANNHGIFGTTNYTGGAFLIGGIIGWGGGANRANGMLAVADQPAGSDSNMGIRAVSGSTTSISSSQVLNVGVDTNATDLALYALTEGPITSIGDAEAARFQTNYTGSAINADSRDPRAQLAGFTTNSQVGGNTMYYGGYLYSGGSSTNSSYAYAGARYGTTNYKIIGNGTVSTIVEGTDGKNKIMFAPEAPEVLFEDYGIGTLSNGNAFITIDPNFSNNIIVDEKHPLKVFIQLEGDCNGVYVTEKTAQGFMVKELQNGTSNTSFSWHIVANRKDEKGSTLQENSDYANLRFPNAPKAIEPQENVATSIVKINPKPNTTEKPMK